MTAGAGSFSVNEFITFVMRTVAYGGEIKGEDRLTAEEVRSIREIEETGLLEGGRWKKDREPWVIWTEILV
jgi:hypothetical protein